MIVELTEVTPDVWQWESTDGLKWDIGLLQGVKPKEAQQPLDDGKAIIKTLIKLKDAGFTAEEIIELSNANLLYKVD